MPPKAKKARVKALTAAQAVEVASRAEGMTVQLHKGRFTIGKVSVTLSVSMPSAAVGLHLVEIFLTSWLRAARAVQSCARDPIVCLQLHCRS